MGKIYKTKNDNNIFKQLRKNVGLTQKEVAQELSIVQTAISKWENGVAIPDQSMLPKIAELYETTTDYLLGRTDNPSPTEQQKKPSIEIESWLQQELDGRQISEKLKKLTEEQKQAALNIFQESVNAFYKDRK